MKSTFISGLEQAMHYITLPGAAALFCVIIFMLLSRKRGRLMMLSLSAAISLNLILKALFRIPNPWMLHPENAPLTAEGGFAFPCAHTQAAAAVLCAFALTSGKRSIRFLCAAGIILTGALRVTFGLQSAADTAAGAAAGILCAALLTRFFYFGKSSRIRIIVYCTVFACGLYTAIRFGNGWGPGLSLAAAVLAVTEKAFRRADGGRTGFGKVYGTFLAAGACAGLYIFLPFLIEWLLTPRWPGQTLIVFLITFIPCLLKLFPVF